MAEDSAAAEVLSGEDSAAAMVVGMVDSGVATVATMAAGSTADSASGWVSVGVGHITATTLITLMDTGIPTITDTPTIMRIPIMVPSMITATIMGTFRGAPQAPQSPPVVIQNYAPPANSGQQQGFYRAPDYYLIAFTDHTIQAAIAFHVQGDQIFWTTREHVDKQAPLSTVDRSFSAQINRDRRVQFNLP